MRIYRRNWSFDEDAFFSAMSHGSGKEPLLSSRAYQELKELSYEMQRKNAINQMQRKDALNHQSNCEEPAEGQAEDCLP